MTPRRRPTRTGPTLSPDERKQVVAENIQDMMREIQTYFLVPMSVTVLVRNPENPEAEICITNDTWEGIRAAVARAEGREG